VVQLATLAVDLGVRTLVGRQATVQQALSALNRQWLARTRRLLFYVADPEHLARSHEYPVRLATERDILSMVELYRGYEFSPGDRTDADIRHEIQKVMDESGTYFVVESPGEDRVQPRIISSARIYPETDRAGMIGAARTLPEFRGRGVYLSVRTACFEHLFRQEKTGLGMFVDSNTSMQRVIEKQGGTILSEWLIADLQPWKNRLSQSLVRIRRRLIPERLRQWALELGHRSECSDATPD
jgi:RimJ/RimL family protein N-acetyltransferase